MPPIGNKKKPSLSEMLAEYLIWQSSDTLTAKIYHGHVIDVLDKMPSRSVQTIVTSPPYWALRDYGDTKEFVRKSDALSWSERTARERNLLNHSIGCIRYVDKRCHWNDQNKKWVGSVSTEIFIEGRWNQVGSEGTPEEYVATMVNVFRSVRRILRDDGTVWLNLGDTYGADNNRNGIPSIGSLESSLGGSSHKPNNPDLGTRDKGLPPGNLVGIPWRVALALQSDGWILRQDNIWSKTNPMPESVQNRCTKSHEYVFLLTKSEKYFYDGEAIKETAKSIYRDIDFIPKSSKDKQDGTRKKTAATGASINGRTGEIRDQSSKKRSVWNIDDHKSLLEWLSVNDPELLARYLDEQTNKSDVWRISSQPYKGAHFATFPPKLVEPCMKAGTSEHGCCSACGSPYERIISTESFSRTDLPKDHPYHRPNQYVSKHDNTFGEGSGIHKRLNKEACISSTKTLGWRATCSCWVCRTCLKPWSHVCSCDGGEERFGKPPIRPCIVLDPFAGTFTTGEVAVSLGRYAWGIELSEKYIRDLAIPRILSAIMQRMADLQWQRRNSQTQ